MRTVRVSIVRGISMPRPSGWEIRSHIWPRIDELRPGHIPVSPKRPLSVAGGEATWSPQGHTATSHPFAHAAHDVVFDRRRRAVVEEGRPNQ